MSDLATWHRVAADEKADSITQLAPPGVETIVEIGCGTGAVLEALDRRGFARRYWGCEPTRELYDAIPRKRIARLVDAEPVPFDQAFNGQSFDLGVLTHVAEHLRTPAVLLAEALSRCSYVLVEVPVEDNIAGRLRVGVKRVLGKSRLDNVPGHVQFFSRRTARALMNHAGGTVLNERAYFPMAPLAASANRPYQQAVVKVGERSSFLGRRYYEHFAMVGAATKFENWNGHYIAPL
jgi:SAM-dependent methyltransferase